MKRVLRSMTLRELRALRAEQLTVLVRDPGSTERGVLPWVDSEIRHRRLLAEHGEPLE